MRIVLVEAYVRVNITNNQDNITNNQDNITNKQDNIANKQDNIANKIDNITNERNITFQKLRFIFAMTKNLVVFRYFGTII